MVPGLDTIRYSIMKETAIHQNHLRVLRFRKERSHSGIWADFNNDGLLDLFIANWSDGTGQPGAPQYLYHNNGNGTFTPFYFRTEAAINGDSFDAAAADFNNDGWIDFFVPQGGVTNRQNGLFTEQSGRDFHPAKYDADVYQ